MTYTLVTAPHAGALRYSEKGIYSLLNNGASPECYADEAALAQCGECGAITCESGRECDLPTPVEVEVYRATYWQPAEWEEGCTECMPTHEPDEPDDDRW